MTWALRVSTMSRFSRSTPARCRTAGRVEQRLTNQLHSLLMAPGAAVGFHQRALGGDPVRLGVHKRAIHIPEHGFERGAAAGI